MQQGVSKTLDMIDAMDKLLVDAIVVVRQGGFRLAVLPKLVDAVMQVNKLIADVPAALPELEDLDGAEAAQIGASAYKLVKDVLAALA